jgi:3-hydroxyacyl-CoA dehydrogenase
LEVYAYDPNAKTLNGLRSAIQAVWPSLEQLGLAVGASIEKLTLCSSLQEAVNGVQYVQESIIERKDQKIQLFHELGELLPEDVIFSTSSSRFVPSELGIKCRAPQRVIVGHPFAPVYLIPLVEILGSPATPSDLLDWAAKFYTFVGKTPVVLTKEIEGYIGNRLQAAYVDEARRMVEEGYCNYEDIDKVIINSFGIRVPFMGLSLYYHLGGGQGGLEHMFSQFGWPGNAESQTALRNAVRKISDKASVRELEQWRDANIVRVLKARQLKPGISGEGTAS